MRKGSRSVRRNVRSHSTERFEWRLRLAPEGIPPEQAHINEWREGSFRAGVPSVMWMVDNHESIFGEERVALSWRCFRMLPRQGHSAEVNSAGVLLLVPFADSFELEFACFSSTIHLTAADELAGVRCPSELCGRYLL